MIFTMTVNNAFIMQTILLGNSKYIKKFKTKPIEFVCKGHNKLARH